MGQIDDAILEELRAKAAAARSYADGVCKEAAMGIQTDMGKIDEILGQMKEINDKSKKSRLELVSRNKELETIQRRQKIAEKEIEKHKRDFSHIIKEGETLGIIKQAELIIKSRERKSGLDAKKMRATDEKVLAMCAGEVIMADKEKEILEIVKRIGENENVIKKAKEDAEREETNLDKAVKKAETVKEAGLEIAKPFQDKVSFMLRQLEEIGVALTVIDVTLNDDKDDMVIDISEEYKRIEMKLKNAPIATLAHGTRTEIDPQVIEGSAKLGILPEAVEAEVGSSMILRFNPFLFNGMKELINLGLIEREKK